MEKVREDELVAAEALLELRNPVVLSWAIPYSWGCKRRRSAEDARPSLLRRFINTPWAALWAEGPVKEEEEEEVLVGLKPEAASFSPDTPLCFSPGSDSSDENNTTRRLHIRMLSINNNMRKQESRGISSLIRNNTNEILKTEVKNAKHLRKLESNRISKARKLKVINGAMKIKEKSDTVLGAENILSQRDTVNPNPIIINDCRDLIPREPIGEDNPTATQTEPPSSCTTYKQPSTIEKEVPRIDIDLNAPPPLETIPPQCWDGSNLNLFDQVGFRRAVAAQARHRRMLIFRTKKNKRGL